MRQEEVIAEMPPLHVFSPSYSIAGFAVGALVGMTGTGGGALMTPLLILLFGIHPATAVGSDLLFAAATKIAGSAVHGRGGTIEWKIVRRLAAGSIPASAVALLLLSHLDLKGPVAHWLVTMVLSVALFATAGALALQKRLSAICIAGVGRRSERCTAGLTILTGAVLGILVSVSSVGAGAIGVTVLFILHPRLPTAKIVGSDIAHAVPLTLVAGMGHWILGSVDWHVVGSLLVGSLPGILLSSYLTVRAPQTVLRLVLAATLAVVAGRLAFAQWQPKPPVLASSYQGKVSNAGRMNVDQ
jgi:uncharacterized protein